MEVTRIVANNHYLGCGEHEFKHMKDYFYIGSQLNQTSSSNSENQTRISA